MPSVTVTTRLSFPRRNQDVLRRQRGSHHRLEDDGGCLLPAAPLPTLARREGLNVEQASAQPPSAKSLGAALTHSLSLQEIGESDLGGIPINTLQVHPNGRRLLIHAKDSVVRVMDLGV